jgi:hypothetical protein
MNRVARAEGLVPGEPLLGEEAEFELRSICLRDGVGEVELEDDEAPVDRFAQNGEKERAEAAFPEKL